MTQARWLWCTAAAPGAIAVVALHGTRASLDAIARGLTGRDAPAVGRISWRRLGDLDDGVLARPTEECMLLMPHGGARIRTLLSEWLARLGAHALGCDADAPQDDCVRVRAAYPEACDDFEALALLTLSHAASPRAVDALLAQPARWRTAIASQPAHAAACASTDDDALRDRLVRPARVVVTGPANAGKSTLMNALAGRAVAVAHDLPGTTRDAVAARLELDGVAVDWFDTPGARDDAGELEREAARTAQAILDAADLVVHLTAPGLGWAALPHRTAPDRVMRVLNKGDTAEAAACIERSDAACTIAARTGAGVAQLAHAVRQRVLPDRALQHEGTWWFHPALAAAVARASATLPRP